MIKVKEINSSFGIYKIYFIQSINQFKLLKILNLKILKINLFFYKQKKSGNKIPEKFDIFVYYL